MNLEACESALLMPQECDLHIGKTNQIVEYAVKGEYATSLKLAVKEFTFLQNLANLSTSSMFDIIKNEINDSMDLGKKLSLFACAISSLQLFIQNNWTGPFDGMLLVKEIWNDYDTTKAEILKLLEIDGDSINENASCLVFLVLSSAILKDTETFTEFSTASWWYTRCIVVHQQLLNERSPTLLEQYKYHLSKVFNKDFVVNMHASLKVQLNLEAGLLSLFYYQYDESEKYFITATEEAGLNVNFTGSLGVRTRFQTKETSQLRIEITRKTALETKIVETSSLPTALKLNDETLLECVKFVDENTSKQPVLCPEEQAVLLAFCTHMTKVSPSQAINKEEILTILQYLVAQPKCWCILIEVLRLRSMLEGDRTKTVERSMLQLESIVNETSNASNNLSGWKRSQLFFSVWNKTIWETQKSLAKLYSSLGVHSSALEIFQKLKMWEDAIICLIITGRGEEAQQLIRKQLENNETATLWCLLGDVLGDPQYYEKAWEFSKQRSYRAMKSLGAYYISKKKYTEAIVCFEKSLKINILQKDVCFSLGCACLTISDYKGAVNAFQRCTRLDWNNYEAWTNLSIAFLRCGDKDKAFRTLQDALKCNFNKWEIWENYKIVCIDTGHFIEAVQAYNKVLDLKEKEMDIEVLKVLTDVIVKKIPNFNGIVNDKLKPSVLNLFGRITSKVTTDWNIWWCYAQTLGCGVANEDSEITNQKALGYIQKAIRYATINPNWEKDKNHVAAVLTMATALINALQFAIDNKNMDKGTLKPLVSSSRLTINGLISKLRKHQNSLINITVQEDYGKLVTNFETFVKTPINNLFEIIK